MDRATGYMQAICHYLRGRCEYLIGAIGIVSAYETPGRDSEGPGYSDIQSQKLAERSIDAGF